ncbi:MAG: GNAT family N-acetyltransferase [Clostridium butyricum]|nr:GNAT family N-acetyltransferase [Clostridium butyricum]
MPYSIVDDNVVVSNVSVNIIDFEVLGEIKVFIQLGTIMTDSKYRNLGLSRFLIEEIIDEWKDKCDLIYLFANDTVLNFYPKFGFNKAEEYQYSKSISYNKSNILFEKLNMDDKNQRNFVYDKVKSSISYSKLSIKNDVDLIMFYCIGYMKENIYYIKEYDLVVFAEFKEDTLIIIDIFGRSYIELDNIINVMANGNINRVILGFTPKGEYSYNVNLYHEEDTTLFVFGKKVNLFNENRFIFSPLSHA